MHMHIPAAACHMNASPMASPPPPTGRNAKHYIVAGLMATLAAAVVVTVFFVVLSPARIYFSVSNASSHQKANGGVVLTFTLAANNTSQRAAVKYQSLFVDLTNNTGADLISWTSANVNTTDMSTKWYPHGSKATVDATLPLLAGPWTTNFFAGGDVAAAPIVVQVAAVVRFKVAGIRTRLYDITVRCGPVIFVGQSRRGRGASSSSSSPAPPVGCSPV